MHVAGFVFSPRLWPTLAYIPLLVLLLSLGNWQLERAQEKREALAARAEAFRAPVVDLTETAASLQSHEYRRAVARGDYDTAHQFYLDNQIEGDRVGYRVLTPLRLAGSERAVLVDRGFTPIVGDRETLPAPPPVESGGEVTGQIGRGPSVGLRLGAPSDNPGEWPRRVQYMDMDYMADALGYPLADFLLRERSLSTDTTARAGIRAPWRFGPERHDGYAFQWFSLAAALTVIWLAVNTRRVANKEDSEE